MVVGTLSLGQKGQTSGCSRIVVYAGGDIVFHAKRSNQRMQSHSGHSTQWTQWTQFTVDAVE